MHHSVLKREETGVAPKKIQVHIIHARYYCVTKFSLLRTEVTGCQSKRTPFAAVG